MIVKWIEWIVGSMIRTWELGFCCGVGFDRMVCWNEVSAKVMGLVFDSGMDAFF